MLRDRDLEKKKKKEKTHLFALLEIQSFSEGKWWKMGKC